MMIEKALSHFLEKTLRGCPAPLAESIRYSVFTPGKRIRPRLLLATGKMLDLDEQTLLPAACALEFFHCFTLIHDDLPCMDNDDFRRGQPSNHKKFGETLALLAGDALQALAVDTFLETPRSEAQGWDPLVLALREFQNATGPRGVIGGQAAEELLSGTSSDLESLKQVHAKKTGALFLAALEIPRIFSAIPPDSEKGQTIRQLGNHLGWSFQIADDLEDPPTTTPPKTSILAYLSREAAIQMSSEELNRLLIKISTLWPEKSSELVHIGEEVLKKLRGI